MERRANVVQPFPLTPSSSPPLNSSSSSKKSLSSNSSTRSSSRFSSTPITNWDRDTPDITALRSQSTTRLLSVWSSLGERYSRGVHEDDIVDIRTGEVIKDRGVLRGLDTKWEFGRFAADGVDNDKEDETADRGGDSDDEINSFPDSSQQVQLDAEIEAEAENPPNAFMNLSTLTARATHAIDPLNDEEDAADLMAFLEAENLRKAALGGTEERDESSSEDLRIEEASEFVTDFDTETEMGYTTEAETLPDGDQLQADKGKKGDDVRELLSDEDELEFWDNNDYIVQSFDNLPTHPPPKGTQSQLATPPRSQSTCSETYLDSVEPIALSPRHSVKSREKSKPRPPLHANSPSQLPVPVGRKNITIPVGHSPEPAVSLAGSEDALDVIEPENDPVISSSPSISTPSASSLLNPPTVQFVPSLSSSGSIPRKIPRLDLTLLTRSKKRGRSYSRSPSKPPRIVPAAPLPSKSVSPHSSTTDIPSQSMVTAFPQLQTKSRRGGTENSASYQHRNGKAKARSAEIDKGANNSFVANLKSKRKLPEVLEISDDESDNNLFAPRENTSRLSAKAKGKKRSRSSGTSYSSEEEARERQVQLLESPSKKGRYAPPDERTPELDLDCLDAWHHSPIDSSSPRIYMSSNWAGTTQRPPEDVTSLTNRQLRGKPLRIHSPPRLDHASNNEYDDQEKHTLRRKSSCQTDRARSDAVFASSEDLRSYPMHVKSHPSYPHHGRHRRKYPDPDFTPQSDPEMTGRQMETALEGHATRIISNAIQGLYSLLSPEGLSGLRGQVHAQQRRPASQTPTSFPPSSYFDSEVDATPISDRVERSPRKRGFDDNRSLPPSLSSSPTRIFPLLRAGSASASFTTPSSHRDQEWRRLHSIHSSDPIFSRGTLPPSSDSEGSLLGHDEYEVRPIASGARDRDSGPHQEMQSSPRPHTSSLVQRSRSRGRKVSFKEIAIKSETRTRDSRRTLSREISVEVEEEPTNDNSHDIEDEENFSECEGEDESNKTESWRRGRRIGTPAPSRPRKSKSKKAGYSERNTQVTSQLAPSTNPAPRLSRAQPKTRSRSSAVATSRTK
ncbi:hypothetical protein D9757_004275 [Collybiopsis confluens]|uniref:Uncharacterized protein n=1 Tax=Collybiopsis confluens TaxID=2823264 RepID=A0A8H5MD29_9AGAR|nr:hypothetical protein D9757_004275 [Collybiopsis confluens]